MTKTIPAKPATETEQRPVGIRATAAILLAEAAGMLVATGYSADATVSGKSYQTASGVALTLIAFGVAVGLAGLGRSIYLLRLWSRTPAMLAQLAGIGAGIYLLKGNRIDWGLPTLVFAIVALIGMFTPDSFRALNR